MPKASIGALGVGPKNLAIHGPNWHAAQAVEQQGRAG